MKPFLFLAAILSLGVVSWAQGQERRPVSERQESKDGGGAQPAFATAGGRLSQDNEVAAPHLVKFSGVLLDVAGKPLSGEVEVTFALYKQEADEEPLWTETQRVEADEHGNYTALLGATQPTGMPAEVFRSDEARWLGVQVQGQAQQPRTVLVSVPYALKAVDAERLGGKSFADFVLSQSLDDQVRRVIEGETAIANQATPTGTLQPGQAKANSTMSPQATTPGPKFPPSMFSGTTSDQIVSVQQNGSGAGLVATSTQNNALFGHSTAGSGVLGLTDSSTAGSGVVGVASSNSTSNNQNGVIGVNAGAGAGVAGIANNPSAGVGVYGQSASFAGVFGNCPAPPACNNGVFGQTVSPDGTGVHGSNNASTGFNSGVSGFSASANGTGVFGSSVQWVGVGGQATATSGGPAYGVWGDSLSTDGAGVAAYADATSGSATGVYAQSSSTGGSGVAGLNNSSVANFNSGVLAINNGTSGNAYGVNGSTQTTGFGAGVAGAAFATTGTAFGVFGQAHSPNGTAVFGAAAPSSGFPTAVVGFLDSPQGGVAGQFVAHTGVGLILQGLSGSNFNQVFSVDANGNLNISGNLTVSGTKSSTAKLQNGREVALYAVESPENWFEDFGSAELKGGVAWVPLDVSFAEATNAAITYHVFLTPNGDSNGLYVARKTAAGFEVREHAGGGSNVAFDYRIVVRRRGYETVRMAEVHGDVRTVESSRQHLIELTNSGTLTKGGVVEVPRNAAVPAIRPVPPRTVVP